MKYIFKNEFDETLTYELQNNNSEILAVMAHGFKGSKDFLLFKKIESMLKGLKVDSLRLDFSGCGESEGNYSDSTIHKQASELNLAIENSGYKKVILIGHSLGCAVSMIMPSINPNICAMILVNPLVFPYVTFSDSLIKYSPYVFLEKINPKDIKLVDKFEKLKESKDKILTKIEKEAIGSKMIDEIKTLDLISYAKKIRMPILIIHGKKDELIPLSHAEYLNYNIKNSKLIILNYFHTPFFKKELNDISVHVVAFIKKLKEKFLK
ncbi:MAG: alpha/beta fold hydrolase [Candidatus Nanoarchaeia archaeon]|jgi:hypothetical protein